MSLDEFIEIYPQKLRRDTEMAPKVKALGEIDDAMMIMWILSEGI